MQYFADELHSLAIKINVHIACLRHMTSNQMIIVQKETFVMQVMAQLQL